VPPSSPSSQSTCCHLSVDLSGSTPPFICAIITSDTKRFPTIPIGFRVTWAEQGLSGLVRGWLPTFIGYGIQGAGKFGFYEVFKK